MRRYTVAIDDRTYTIDVSETGADTFEVSVEGATYEAALTGHHDLPGIAISPQLAVSQTLQAALATAPKRPAERSAVRDVVPEASVSPSAPARRAAATLAAPMPGVILEVIVAAGAVVRRGDPLLVLEAMKMRNTIRAPRDATVLEVVASAGSSVAAGEPLVRFGAPPG